MRQISDVLEFWFSERAQAKWFDSDDAFDREIEATFGATHAAAHRGELDDWAATPEGALALIVLLDQFPRNMFRATPKAFASDPKAREIARLALKRGHDRAVPADRRSFLYLPFEHSEDLADQELSLRLYRAYGSEKSMEYAVGHHDVIRKFGRFPHRNKFLGRPNTPEEEEYLKDPDAGW